MHSRDFSRADRLSDLIRAEISLMLRDEIKDPRLKGMTIINAEMSKDLKKVYVYFSSLNSFSEIELVDVLKGLSKAKGFMRNSLGKRLNIKRVPELVFKQDILTPFKDS